MTEAFTQGTRRSRDYERKLGAFIRTKRLERGWTQVQLAEAIGMRQNTISQYELGLIGIEVTRAQDIAEALGVSLIELVQCGEATCESAA